MSRADDHHGNVNPLLLNELANKSPNREGIGRISNVKQLMASMRISSQSDGDVPLRHSIENGNLSLSSTSLIRSLSLCLIFLSL